MRESMQAVVAKARSLLNLRRHATTPGEAEAAARALAKIIERYRIDEAALDGSCCEYVETSDPVWSGTVVPPWKEHLIAALGRNFSVQVSRLDEVVWRSSRTCTVKGYYLCGTPTDIAAVKHMFAWLSAETVRLGRIFGKRLGGRRRSVGQWRLGFVHGVISQLRAARKEAREDAPVATKALVVLDERYAKVQAFFDQMHPNRPPATMLTPPPRFTNAYLAGVVSGGKFHLGKSLPGHKEQNP